MATTEVRRAPQVPEPLHTEPNKPPLCKPINLSFPSSFLAVQGLDNRHITAPTDLLNLDFFQDFPGALFSKEGVSIDLDKVISSKSDIGPLLEKLSHVPELYAVKFSLLMSEKEIVQVIADHPTLRSISYPDGGSLKQCQDFVCAARSMQDRLESIDLYSGPNDCTLPNHPFYFLQTLLEKCPKLKCLRFTQSDYNSESIYQFLETLSTKVAPLEELHLRGFMIHERAFELLIQKCVGLKRLSIDCYVIDPLHGHDDALIKISQQCPDLESFFIGNLSFGCFSAIMGHRKSHEPDGLLTLARNCKNLREIYFHTGTLEGGDLDTLTKECGERITHLSVSDPCEKMMKRIEDPAIRTVFDRCPNLRHFSISKCSNVHNEAFSGLSKCPQLESLHLQSDLFDLKLNAELFQAIASPGIKELHIEIRAAQSFEEELCSTFSHHFPNLQTLKLQSNPLNHEKACSLVRGLHALKELEFVCCDDFSIETIIEIVDACPLLKELRIKNEYIPDFMSHERSAPQLNHPKIYFCDAFRFLPSREEKIAYLCGVQQNIRFRKLLETTQRL